MMKTFKKSCLTGSIYHLFLFAFSLACGYFVSALLDMAMGENSQVAVQPWLWFLAVLLTGLPVIYFWQKILGRIIRSDRQNFREKLYGDIIKRRIPVESVGEMDVRLSNDADTVAEYFQSAVPAAVEGIGIILGATLLLCRVHFFLGLLLFGLSLLQLLPSIVYEKWAKEIYEQTDDAEEDYDNWMVQGCEGLGTLKAYQKEEWFAKKLDGISDGMVSVGCRAEKTGAVETVVFQFVDGVLRYGSYVMMGLFVLYGGLKVADTPVLIVLSSYLFGSVNHVLEALQKRFEFQVAREHLKEVELPEQKGLEEWEMQVQPEGLNASKQKKFAGSKNAAPLLLKVSDLHKNFGEKNIFSDISFTVRAGERVLLCGANGSGKSTLLRVVLGLLAADKGNVFLNPEDVSFALQEEADLTLTGDEVFADLCAEGAVDGGKMKEYFRGFGITAQLLEKPLGDWSMGERKKFYLSAAFAQGREILVLDEPTNHVDAAALEYLYGQIAHYPGAVLAVSHQKGIPVAWDQVISLQEEEKNGK